MRNHTGHEHLAAFKLINMNGRMYDPLLARMVSFEATDPFIPRKTEFTVTAPFVTEWFNGAYINQFYINLSSAVIPRSTFAKFESDANKP